MTNHKYNTDYLVPLTQKKAEMISSIEEAEWMQEDTSLLYAELEHIKRDIIGGVMYHPLF